MSGHLSHETLNQIQAAADRGEVILAIKLHREATGASLAESKAFVDSLRPGDSAGGTPGRRASGPGTPANPDQLDPELAQALYGGSVIAAIRRHRELNPGLGLAQAKEEMESLSKQLRAAHPERFTKPTPSGCGTQVVALVAVAVTAAIAFALSR